MMRLQFTVFAFAIALALMPASTFAKPSEEQKTANRAAQELGRTLYLHDQAAWHGTDALFAKINPSDHPELRGYLSERMENGNMALVFFAEYDGSQFEFARYEVAGSEVVGGGRHSDPRAHPLSPRMTAMAKARQTILERFGELDLRLCSQYSPNTIVLPPDQDGNVPVYILTSTQSADNYPLGGHYLLTVKPDGEISSRRAFMNSCMDAKFADAPENRAVAFGVSHILDPQPTEIHYFASHYIPLTLFVITDKQRTWKIERGEFQGLLE